MAFYKLWININPSWDLPFIFTDLICELSIFEYVSKRLCVTAKALNYLIGKPAVIVLVPILYMLRQNFMICVLATRTAIALYFSISH
ncbi:hypothetical protein A3716_32815 [Alcanivorax sp. HI0011]|nr:hypothetical protein A3716_32815 [Alcanivorax sp. HI0011]